MQINLTLWLHLLRNKLYIYIIKLCKCWMKITIHLLQRWSRSTVSVSVCHAVCKTDEGIDHWSPVWGANRKLGDPHRIALDENPNPQTAKDRWGLCQITLQIIFFILHLQFLPHYGNSAETTYIAKSFCKRIAVDLQLRHLKWTKITNVA